MPKISSNALDMWRTRSVEFYEQSHKSIFKAKSVNVSLHKSNFFLVSNIKIGYSEFVSVFYLILKSSFDGALEKSTLLYCDTIF